MSTIHCPGGHAFSDNEIPSKVSFHLIPDAIIEPLTATIIDAARNNSDAESVIAHRLLTSGIDTYRCPHCARIIVFWNGPNAAATSYMQE